MKQKHNSAEKSRKKKFHPLRRQIEFWFIGLFLLSMVIINRDQWTFSGTLLYQQKTDVLQEAVKKSRGAEDDNRLRWKMQCRYF